MTDTEKTKLQGLMAEGRYVEAAAGLDPDEADSIGRVEPDEDPTAAQLLRALADRVETELAAARGQLSPTEVYAAAVLDGLYREVCTDNVEVLGRDLHSLRVRADRIRRRLRRALDGVQAANVRAAEAQNTASTLRAANVRAAEAQNTASTLRRRISELNQDLRGLRAARDAALQVKDSSLRLLEQSTARERDLEAQLERLSRAQQPAAAPDVDPVPQLPEWATQLLSAFLK